MVRKNPIKCPACNAVVVEDEKNLRHYVIKEDIKCPKCGKVVIYANNLSW
jgi:predicted RNA-binding Zn-ribbon protein involved in translation (DUF1610 family)